MRIINLKTPVYVWDEFATHMGRKTIPKLDFNYLPAKTAEEAKEFAEKKLGIEKFSVSDVSIANMVNHGLYNILRRFRGKFPMPESVTYNFEKDADLIAYTRSNLLEWTSSLNINKSFFTDVDGAILRFCNRKFNADIKNTKQLTPWLKKNFDKFLFKKQERLRNLLNAYYEGNLNKLGKMKLYLAITDVMAPKSITGLIYHEAGHIKSNKTLFPYTYMLNEAKPKWAEKDISKYAGASVHECWAEIFCQVMQGVPISERAKDFFMKNYGKFPR